MSDTKTALAIPDPQEIDKTVQPLLQRVRTLNIADEQQYYDSANLLKELEASERTFLPPFEKHLESAKATLKSAKELLARFADPLDAAKKFIGTKRTEYRARIAQAEIDKQNRINAEAARVREEAARVERERLQKIADDAEALRIATAEKLREQGMTEAADEAIAAASALRELDDLDTEEAVAAVIPEPEQIQLAAPVFAATSGVGLRRNYKFRVVDVNALSDNYILPRQADEGKIGKDVRNQKEAKSLTPTPSKLIPGIEVWYEETDFTRKEKNAKDDF